MEDKIESSFGEHVDRASQDHLDPEHEEEDTITILVATDNHLGYLEKDPVRGNDSFEAFEEILKLAVQNEVDMVLLGGDLFHENKPSRKTLHITTKLLRQYCMGDRPVSLEFLSDPKETFPEGVQYVNYQDPNLNISLPVFSIHGNHDDPSGDGNLCALDLLAMDGLVNYFGRSKEVDDVIVTPILLQKGATRLAMFGLGNIRDERLHQTFLRRHVRMRRPLDDGEEEENPWFNLLVLHQNRVMHGPKNYIPEEFLDDFINLVVWGHEHECLVEPSYNPQRGFHVSQPGSSVATSLCEGESKTKHVAIVRICKNKFDLEKKRLKTVRPFLMDEVFLNEHQLDNKDQKMINKFLTARVQAMIETAQKDWMENQVKNKVPGGKKRRRAEYNGESGDDSEGNAEERDPDKSFQRDEEGVDEEELQDKVPVPLIRLRVEYSGGFEIFNPQRFGQAFVGKVANPKDVIQFFRRKAGSNSARDAGTGGSKRGGADMDVVEAPDRLDNTKVEDLVQKYLSAQNLNILTEAELMDAVRIFVEKDEKDAINEFFNLSLDRMQGAMESKANIDVDAVFATEVTKEKKLRAEKYALEHPTGAPLVSRRRPDATDGDGDHQMDSDDQGGSDGQEPVTSKGRGRGGAAAAAATKTPTARGGRGRGARGGAKAAASGSGSRASTPAASRRKAAVLVDSMDEDDDFGGDVVQQTDSEDNGRVSATSAASTAKRPSRVAAATSKKKNAVLVADTDDDDFGDDGDTYQVSKGKTRRQEEEGDNDDVQYLNNGDNDRDIDDDDDDDGFDAVPPPKAQQKGKGRVAAPPKPKATTKPKATPKIAAAAAKATLAAGGSSSTVPKATSGRVKQAPSGASQPSSLLASLAGRRSKASQP